MTSVDYDGLGRATSRTDGEGFTTTSTYDAAGNLLTRTSPRGGVERFVVDAMDRVVSATNAEDETTTSAYDAQGNLVEQTNPEGIASAFTYEARDLLTRTVENAVEGAPASADTNVATATAYDVRGLAVAVTDPRGNATTYELDALGRMVTATDALGRVTRTGYDATGRLATATAADGTVSVTSYTPDGFTASVAYVDQTVSYGYDAVGNRTSMKDRLGTSTWSVDWAGRATSATDARGKEITYGFDLVGNEVRTIYPDGRVLTRTFDGRGLALTQTDAGGTTSFTHDPDGDLAAIVRPSGVETAIDRDLVGRVTSVVHSGRGVVPGTLPSGEVNPASMAPGNAYGHCKGGEHPNQQPAGCETGTLAFTYVHDDRGLVTHRDVATDEATTATDYTHDGLGRLTRSATGIYVATYGWDAASNLLTEAVSDDLATHLADDGRAITRTVNAVNQTTSIVTDFGQWPSVLTSTTALAYDLRGNRTSEVTTRTTSGVTHVLNAVASTYDGLNQVVGTHDTGDNQNSAKDDVITTWSRDGMGRALVVKENQTTRARVYDGLDVVVDGATRITRGPSGQALFEAFETVVGHGSKATTLTTTRDVLTDVLGSSVSVATGGVIGADLALFGDFGELLTEPDAVTVTTFTGPLR